MCDRAMGLKGATEADRKIASHSRIKFLCNCSLKILIVLIREILLQAQDLSSSNLIIEGEYGSKETSNKVLDDCWRNFQDHRWSILTQLKGNFMAHFVAKWCATNRHGGSIHVSSLSKEIIVCELCWLSSNKTFYGWIPYWVFTQIYLLCTMSILSRIFDLRISLLNYSVKTQVHNKTNLHYSLKSKDNISLLCWTSFSTSVIIQEDIHIWSTSLHVLL